MINQLLLQSKKVVKIWNIVNCYYIFTILYFFNTKMIFTPGQTPKMKRSVLLKQKNDVIFLAKYFPSSIELQPLPSSVKLQPQPFANRNPQFAPEVAIHNPQLIATTSHWERLPQPSRNNEIEFFNIHRAYLVAKVDF